MRFESKQFVHPRAVDAPTHTDARVMGEDSLGEPRSPSRANDADAQNVALASRRASLDGKVLVGGEGGDYIAATLSSAADVHAAIEHVRALGSLLDKDTEPVLGLLGALGVRRGEAYREMLDRAIGELTRRAATLPQGTLLSLLDASFPYIGIAELKVVPLTVFAHMSPVPSSYLKQVSRDMEIFRQLPVEVQRQCWAMDAQLLRRHVSPSMIAYGEEMETVAINMNQDVTLTPLEMDDDWSPGEGVGVGGGGADAGALSRQKMRKGSASVQRLMNIIGNNPVVYIEVIRLCRAHFANSGDDAACSLRSQLLMAFHDKGETELCSKDKCHRLAWLMDACIRDRYLDGRRLREMGSIIENAVQAAVKARAKAKPKAPKPTRFRLVGFGAAAKKDGNESDDGGSISRVHDAQEKDDAFEQVPGDMGMILQDPPVLHLLLHETIRTLEGVIEAEGVPKKEQRLHDLTKFICLGLTSEACLRENVSYIPATPKEILHGFFPLLGDLMLSAMLRDSDDDMETEENAEPAADMTPEVRQKFKELMIWSPAVRKIMLTYALICLQRNNLRTATEVLDLAAEILTDATIIFEGAFAVTLCRRISKLLESKDIDTKSAIWKHAVDGILIRATAASLEVHGEVLRLLISASDVLTPEELGHAVEATLINTKKSRKQRRKRAKQIVYEYEATEKINQPRRGSSHNFGATAEEPESGADKLPESSIDAIRTAYQSLASKGKLNEQNAPVLFDYVSKHSKRDVKDAGAMENAGADGYFDDEGEEGGSMLDFGLSRDIKSPSVIRDSPMVSPPGTMM